MNILRAAWAVAVGAFVLVTGAVAKHPYTVDDMLRLEEIGKVRFDAKGQHIIFERYGPFEQQSDFSRSFVRGEYRSKLYVADLDSQAEPKPLFQQNPLDGYTLNGLSPDGERVAFDRITQQGIV